MSAYFVFTREKTLDEEELKIYFEKVQATFEGHPVKFLVAHGCYEVVEGDPIEDVVIAEFPTLEAAKGWYDSAAYQAVRDHRFKGAIYRSFLAEGVASE